MELRSAASDRKALGLGLALFIWIGLVSPVALAKSEHKFYLTREVKDGVPLNKPRKEFGCSDKIFAVLELDGLPKGGHRVEAIWRDPQGKDREHTKYPFTVARQKERIWVWLKLHHAPEAALVQFADPSVGMEEFIGKWGLRVLLDGKQVANTEFTVLC